MSIIQYAHEKMYKMLRRELDECLIHGPCKKSIEQCFIIAGNYWSELKAAVAEYKFRSLEEEIYFFKTVKPLFTTELEYYSLLYHTMLFCPLDAVRQKQFWEREARRLDDFKEQHKVFLVYYRAGDTSEDPVYYVRANDSHAMDGEIAAYDGDPNSKTSYDQLIAKLWALERYNEYVQGKLKELSKLI